MLLLTVRNISSRYARGLTRAELGRAVGAFQRLIANYEGESGQRPGALLAHLARALRVTGDELLRLNAATDKPYTRTAQLFKWLRAIENQPSTDRRPVLSLLPAERQFSRPTSHS